MQLFYAPGITNTPHLPSDEAKHCLKILRHKMGDIIDVTDGKGFFYSCELLNNSGELKIISSREESTKRKYNLHLAIAPPKSGERTDWMIEKLVEFGVDEITFLDCAHSERNRINMERCERIAVSAMKQSLKAWLPEINPLVPFNEFISSLAGRQDITRLLPHCNELPERKDLNTVTETKQNILCCVGPEGDFAKHEVLLAGQNGFQGIRLGPSRLRTETAAMSVCSYFYFNL